jgi:hypothetical protein
MPTPTYSTIFRKRVVDAVKFNFEEINVFRNTFQKLIIDLKFFRDHIVKSRRNIHFLQLDENVHAVNYILMDLDQIILGQFVM